MDVRNSNIVNLKTLINMLISKSALVDLIQADGNKDLTKHNIKRVVDTLFTTIEACLQTGNVVEIKNFCKFFTKEQPQQLRRDPRTGDAVIARSKIKPHCKLSTRLKQRIISYFETEAQ